MNRYCVFILHEMHIQLKGVEGVISSQCVRNLEMEHLPYQKQVQAIQN